MLSKTLTETRSWLESKGATLATHLMTMTSLCHLLTWMTSGPISDTDEGGSSSNREEGEGRKKK